MEALIGLAAVAVIGVLMLMPVVALVALTRANQALRELAELRVRLARGARSSPPVREEGLASAEPPPGPLPQPPVAVPARVPVPEPRPAAAAPPAPGVSPRPVAPRPIGRPDFATSLGPKILVGAGGLAVVVFLGLFVRYAWENNWVGPLGRVLSAAAFSLALVAGGLRIMEGRYRPLGQGLTAAGLAGLYVTAWAAHAVYGLVPRGTAALMLVAVTAAALWLGQRRDARLLALLAWVGGYLAPVLLSTGEDRGETLLAYLVVLGTGAAWLDRQKRWPETLPLAALGTLVLGVAWYQDHFGPERLLVAAAGLVILTALFTLAKARDDEAAPFFAGLAIGVGAAAAIPIASNADRPLALAGLLAALALLAAAAARRWTWTLPVAAVLAAGAVLAWHERFFAPWRVAEALTLGLTTAGLYVGLVTVRAGARRAGVAGALAHVVAAALAWTTLDRVLTVVRPDLLGVAAFSLAALHLALGLAARARGEEALRVRVSLSLAVAFFTLAVPAQLGLHGATLAWAVEGVLLAWLGVRQHSPLARAFGYAVLLLAVCRLFLRHLPLHALPFTPLANPAFGTWLGVVLALTAAHHLACRVAEDEDIPWLDGAARLVLGPLGLALLFGLLTSETQSFFDHASRAAVAAGDGDGALRAERQAGLAVSLLWTVFATGLLAAGLGLRSRPLFYASYALFALTAGKVVLVDLATLPTLYRMLSFLGLGVLLLAGAWLNLRLRERLSPPGPG